MNQQGRSWPVYGISRATCPAASAAIIIMKPAAAKNLTVATLHIAEAIACRLGRGITPANHPQFLSSSIDRNSSEIVAKAQAALGLTRDDIMHAIRSAEERGCHPLTAQEVRKYTHSPATTFGAADVKQRRT